MPNVWYVVDGLVVEGYKCFAQTIPSFTIKLQLLP